MSNQKVPGMPPVSNERTVDHALERWMSQIPQWFNTAGNQVVYPVVANAFTFQPVPATDCVIFSPAGALASGTLTLPANANDGALLEVSTTAAIGTLTLALPSGQSLIGSGSFALAANAQVRLRYRTANQTWYRTQ